MSTPKKKPVKAAKPKKAVKPKKVKSLKEAAVVTQEVAPAVVAAPTPRNFIIRCGRCRWATLTTGLKADLTALHEIRNTCATCGRPRQFKCPTCGSTAKMKRIRGNT